MIFLFLFVFAGANICPNPASYAGKVVCNWLNAYCGECVSLYVTCANDHRVTSSWTQGVQVKGANIPFGTGIATFPNGKYLGHAAIYVKQDSTGITVWDQWKGQPVHQRVIRWGGGGNHGVNDGNAFYVIGGGRQVAVPPPPPPTGTPKPKPVPVPVGFSDKPDRAPKDTSGANTNNPDCFYTVKSGDTLSGIAAKKGYTLQQIINANPQISNPNLIQIGQQVRLPCPSAVGSPKPVPVPKAAAPKATPKASPPPPKASPPPPKASPPTGAQTSARSSFYLPAGGFGSCGNKLQNDDMVVAMPSSFMKQNCGKCINVRYNGKSIVVKVADTCPGCNNQIDLTIGAWKKLEPNTDKGIIQVTWGWTSCSGGARQTDENGEEIEEPTDGVLHQNTSTPAPPVLFVFLAVGAGLLLAGLGLALYLVITHRKRNDAPPVESP